MPTGRFWFRSIMPSFYPIPHDGPVGRDAGRAGPPSLPAGARAFHDRRRGYETLVTHIFIDGDRYLDSDVVFGVKDELIRGLERLKSGTTPAGHAITGPTALLRYDFVLGPAKTAR